MKNLLSVFLCIMISGGTAFAQKTDTPVKKNQFDVQNEFYVYYGIGSLYYYISRNSNSGWSYTTYGSFIVGYTRSLNKVIGVGFELAYTPISRTYNLSTSSNQSTYYNYIQALARIRFQYLNRPAFGMYSGIAIGVTMDYYSETSSSGVTTNKQDLLPAGQLALLGFRVGRGAAFSGEFGIGTLSILNIGFSYKFGQ